MKKIPISGKTLLTEVRQRIAPFVVFFGGVVVCAFLWMSYVVGGQASGIAEGVRSTVINPRVALIKKLSVKPYQWVQEGQELAVMVPVDPNASLDLLQSELTLARIQMEPTVGDRNAIDFEQIRIDFLRMQQDLEISKVNLERAEKVFKRNEQALKDRLITEDVYDLSLNERDMWRNDVAGKTSALGEIKQRMDVLSPMTETLQGTNTLMDKMLSNADVRLKDAYSNAAPYILRAPVSGMIQSLTRSSGEYSAEGEPLMVICKERADRIVAYLRQPYVVEPQLGQSVEVLTRTSRRQRFTTQVTHVGAQMEVITNSLAFVKPGAMVDSGLPVVLQVPETVDIRPGEIVDLVFLDERQSSQQPVMPLTTTKAKQ